MEIKRDTYLEALKKRKHNGMIKIITGIRRCGKSYLLFRIFKNYLIESNVDESHIIEIAFDNRANKELRDPDECLKHISARIKDNDLYYILLDEVQMLSEFEDVLNSLLHIDNADVYATGSNSRFLSSDIITEFRGRGDEIRVHPLTFKEFYDAKVEKDFPKAWKEYYTYGGMPYVLSLDDEIDKENYLKSLFGKTYISDIIERNKINNTTELDELLDMISSSIGSLTNPNKLENTFKSNNKCLSAPTIKQYLDYFEDAFIIKKAKRYDIKGKRYISTPFKYYFTDIGLRNARLNFRQQERTHIMENIIFNELEARGYSVDVGIIEIRERASDKYEKKQIEIDFVVNRGNKRYYIQSAYSIPDIEKEKQEKRPLLNIDDSFRKIIIVNDIVKASLDDNGILTISLEEFLLNKDSLDI